MYLAGSEGQPLQLRPGMAFAWSGVSTGSSFAWVLFTAGCILFIEEEPGGAIGGLGGAAIKPGGAIGGAAIGGAAIGGPIFEAIGGAARRL